jgi:hypothetical protein
MDKNRNDAKTSDLRLPFHVPADFEKRLVVRLSEAKNHPPPLSGGG